MGFRRLPDGKVVEDPSRITKEDALTVSPDRSTDTPTKPVSDSSIEDSLFDARPSQTRDRRLTRKSTSSPSTSNQGDVDQTRLVPRNPPVNLSKGQGQGLDPVGLVSDPPVGWLVVVRGAGKGRVLTLGTGMNTMGRGQNARLRLNFGDRTIARENHARFFYEPRGRRFFLNHGDGSNLTYLNGVLVTESVAIESGAMIEIGSTTLRFQAFCSEAFDWGDQDD